MVTMVHLLECITLSRIIMLYSWLLQESLVFIGPRLWNNLPVELWQRKIAFEHFKHLLNMFLFVWDCGALRMFFFCLNCAGCKHTYNTYLLTYRGEWPVTYPYQDGLHVYRLWVTHPSTNRTRRCVTSLIMTNALITNKPLVQCAYCQSRRKAQAN